MKTLASILLGCALIVGALWWILSGPQPEGMATQPIPARDADRRQEPETKDRPLHREPVLESSPVSSCDVTISASAAQGTEEPGPLEQLTARLDEYRARYGSLSEAECESALSLANQCFNLEIIRFLDDLTERGLFDKEVVVTPGESVDPPAKLKKGRTSARVISEPLEGGLQSIKFVVAYHDDDPQVAALEKERSWLSSQLAALRKQ